VRSKGGEWKVLFASLAFHRDALDEVFELTVVTVAGDITIMAAGSTNRSSLRETLQQQQDSMKPKSNKTKPNCIQIHSIGQGRAELTLKMGGRRGRPHSEHTRALVVRMHSPLAKTDLRWAGVVSHRCTRNLL
jgi:hypothetical protein